MLTQLSDALGNLLEIGFKQRREDEAKDAAAAKVMQENGWQTLYEVLSDVKPDTPSTDTLTSRVIAAMMRENTGRHFLDSGFYGRAFERNQVTPFEDGPEVEIRFNVYSRRGEDPMLSVEYTKNLYHFLVNNLSFAPYWNHLFHEVFVPEVDPEDDKSWLELMAEFPHWLEGRGWRISTGPYGESDLIDGSCCIENSYNSDSALSQVIQFAHFHVEADDISEADADILGDGYRDSIVLLQIHGGADVRGGYTQPVAFTEREFGGASLYTTGDGYLECNHCRDRGNQARWQTETAGYSWDFVGTIDGKYPRWSEAKAYKLDHDTPAIDLEDVQVTLYLNWSFYIKKEHVVKLFQQRAAGSRFANWYIRKFITDKDFVVLVDTDDHSAYCPFCYTGKLEAF